MDSHDFEMYESLFDPLQSDRQARRKRKPKPKHIPKKIEAGYLAGDGRGTRRS